MRRDQKNFRLSVLAVAALSVETALWQARANPQGGTVAAGSANITSSGSQLFIQTSDHAVLNWQHFNIDVGETTTFLQPSSSSIVWNRINDPNASQILGTLNANGYVVLQNQAGFYIGGKASLNTGGLVLTTSPTPPPDLFSGGAWQFDSPPPSASIINYGQINVSAGGSAFLIAMDIENGGSITAPGGNVGLYAGKKVLVSGRPDGRGLSAQVTLPAGSVDNTGKLIADAGTIALNAQVVNQGGLIQANSVREVNGVIEIVASDSVNLGAASHIEAKGDSQVVSAGGSVQVRSGNTFSDAVGSTINVSGGAIGGNGGQVEISAPQIGSIQSQVQGGAIAGWKGGQLSIDPQNILLSTAGTAATGTGGSTTVGVNDPPTAGTLTLMISSFSTFSQILLQASQDITVGASWTLADSKDLNATLTLEAGRNILFTAGASISAGKNWSVNLDAGQDFTKSAGTVIAGTGSVDLTGSTLGDGTGSFGSTVHTQNGSLDVNAGGNIYVSKGNLQTTTGALNANAGSSLSISSGNLQTTTGALTVNAGQNLTIAAGDLQTTSGGINVIAKQNITLTSGAIRTIGGGNINVKATAGDIDINATAVGSTSSPVQGFVNSSYTPSPTISGISTIAGGNVTIEATAGSVYSYLPTGTSATEAGSGAYGPQPGIVTVTAGKDVGGHFVAINSVDDQGNIIASTISAGGAAGISGDKLALSLVKGGWRVMANIIGLQEVRDPSGIFFKGHTFDYDPNSFVDLTAGTSVELFGGGPRATTGTAGASPTGIFYPPTLNISAGSGGVTIDKPVILLPSANGNLNITTSDKGALTGSGGDTPDLLMSDSAAKSYVNSSTFGINDHAGTPIESGNSSAAVLSIDGNMENFFFVASKKATIFVGGEMRNSYFQGQNLQPGDTTYLTVLGQLILPNSKSFFPLDTALSATEASELNASFLGSLLDANGNPIFSGSSVVAPTFFYTSGSLVVAAGKVSQAQFNLLVNTDTDGNQTLKTFYLQPIDPTTGKPQVDPVTGKAVVDLTHPITILSVDALNFFLANSANISTDLTKPTKGLLLSGPGDFNITAGSVDLGFSLGIQTLGAGYSADGSIVGNPALLPADKTMPAGANIDLSIVDGGLTMFSSTIATTGGGDINISAPNGAINVGSSSGLGLQNPTSGIFAAGPGSVTVFAKDTIDISGSRIATFDGGNISLTSATGDVDAGNGAANDLTVYLSQYDPVSKTLVHLENIFNGSGIIAYTLPLNLPNDDGSIVLHNSPTALPGNINITSKEGSIIGGEGGIVQEPLNGNESSAPMVNLNAKLDIDLSGSGIIGGTVSLNAGRNVSGLAIAVGDAFVNAGQNFSGTLLSGGTASLSAGGISTGTVIGITGINVGGGGTVEATLLSQNVSVGGAQAAGLATTATASAASQSASQEATAQAKDQTGQDTSQSDDDEKKKVKRILLAKSTGRVTVILPGTSKTK